jgi:hypothetical protein
MDEVSRHVIGTGATRLYINPDTATGDEVVQGTEISKKHFNNAQGVWIV